MSVIGYARVSTSGQDAGLQVQALEAAGALRIFTDTASGSGAAERPALSEALDFAREGDTLTVWRLDRLGRSLRDLIDQVGALEERGIGFWSLTESLDTTTAGGRMVFHIFGALAEFERQLIRDRTIAGLEVAKAAGRVGGRPTVMTPERIAEAARMRAEGKSLDAIAAVFGVGRSSVTRALTKATPADTTSVVAAPAVNELGEVLARLPADTRPLPSLEKYDALLSNPRSDARTE